MSFLLDALRKSEIERRVGEVPRLTPDPPIQARSAQPKRHPFIFLVAVLVLINFGTLVYIASHDRTGTKDARENPPSSGAPRATPGSVEKTGPNADSDSSVKVETQTNSLSGTKPTVSGKTPSPATLADIAAAGQNQTGHQPSGLMSSGKRSPRDAENRGAHSLEKQFPVLQPTPPMQNPTSDRQKQPVENGPLGVPSKPIQLTKGAATPVNLEQPKVPVTALQPVGKPATIPQAAPINTPANDAIPLLAGMPSDFQREVPSLNINVFVYSEIPEDRFVIINMSKYLAGQKIDSGPEILEIRPDSVVLDYLGRKFRIKRP